MIFIPDRMSARTLSLYFDIKWLSSGTVKVRLDGVEMRDVIEYCISEGWLRRTMRHPDGKAVIVGDEFAEETLHGAVTVTYELKGRRV